MKRYSKLRWVLSQIYAYFFKTRRFISLSFPTSKRHRIFDTQDRLIINIYGRGAEDVISIIQIFIAEFYNLKQLGVRYGDLVNDYNSILATGKTPLIIDCGANIGLTSVYLSKCFPLAKVVSIEPDQTNCDFSVLNTKGRDVDVLRAAVGNKMGACSIVDSSVNSNSFRVEADNSGREKIDMLTVDNVIQKYSDRCIPFIIKIDIEGFERNLFENEVDWISRFRLMIIELHDWMLPKEANSLNFLRAISRENRDFVFYNENIFSIKN